MFKNTRNVNNILAIMTISNLIFESSRICILEIFFRRFYTYYMRIKLEVLQKFVFTCLKKVFLNKSLNATMNIKSINRKKSYSFEICFII